MNLRTAVTRIADEVERLRSATDEVLAAIAEDPIRLMEAARLAPDPWQRDLLLESGPSGSDTLLLCTRQGGKSTATAALALYTALCQPGALVLLLSPSLRQSQELFLKVLGLWHAAGEPVAATRVSTLRLELVHGSRILALPGTEKTVRGFSGVDLLVIDEAARVLDELYYSIRPMLAVSGGRLVALTTPWGKRGWFYDEWSGGSNSWSRIRITAQDCPRITAAFLEQERASLPPAWFKSEYLCEFVDTVDQVFQTDDIEAAFSTDVTSLFE